MRGLLSLLLLAGLMGFLALATPVELRGEESGTLHILILDRQTGHTVPARCYLTDSAGKPWFPAESIVYVHPPEQHFVTAGEFRIDLPPGRYTIRAERGPEYSEAERPIAIRPGETSETMLQIEHLIEMNQRHWYSGDLHIHREVKDVPELVQAEDLNIAPIITDWFSGEHLQHLKIPPTAGAGPIRWVDPMHIFSINNAEVERPYPGGAGTMDMLALDRAIDFQNTSLLAPPDIAFTEQTHQRHGYVDAEKILYRDTSALAALGQIDFAGIVHNWFTRYGVIQADPLKVGMIARSNPDYATPRGMPLWSMDIYYQLLNCGFKLPVSAGSASGVLPNPVGFNRVYVHLPGAFGFNEWFNALKAGRNFATNGPMLFLSIDGHDVGDSIELPITRGSAGRALTVEAEAISTHDLDRLEIVWKGKVIKTLVAGEDQRTLRVRFNFAPQQSGWFAARAFEKTRETRPAPDNHPVRINGYQSVADIPSHGWATAPARRFAHTSPIYVQFGNEPIRDAAAATFLLAWVDREIQHFQTLPTFRNQADRERMLAMLREARNIYARLLGASSSR